MIQLAERAGQAGAIPPLRACFDAERAMAERLHAHFAPTLDRRLELRAQKGRSAGH